MNRRTTRWARLAMASCIVTAVVGCDNSESAYLDQQASAIAVRAAGGSGSEVAEKLTSATDGTLPVNIQANQLLGQSRLSDARLLANSLAVNQSAADAVVSRIGSLASMAGVAQTWATGYRQMEPTASLSLMKDLSAKVRGDGNLEKFSELPNGSIPTLAAVQQEKSRLEGELAKAQNDLQTATTQRDQLLSQVGILSGKADQQRGQEKLDTVTQAADLRQQAAVVSRTISDLEAKISLLNADLEVQKSLETSLQNALQSFDAQHAALTSGWAQTKERVEGQSQLAQAILKAPGTEVGQTSVASLSADLVKQFDELNQQREQTLAAFDDAIQKFTAAETAANTYNASITNSSDSASANAPAWKSLASTLNIDRYNLQKAVAMREQATVLMSHASFLLHMAGVAQMLESLPQTLNAPAPEPFNLEKLRSQAAEAVKNADELLTQAKDRVDGVSAQDENLAGLRPLKWSTAIFVNHDRALLSKLASTAKLEVDVAKEETYKASIDDAKAAIVAAREASVAVPKVPADIYVEPPKPVEEKPAETATSAATPDSPLVAELRQSLRDVIGQAQTAQDNPQIVEQLFARIKSDETSQAAVTLLRELVDAQVRVETATKAKFGDEGVAALKATGGSSDPTEQINALPIKEVDETHATVTFPLPMGLAPTLKFVKEEEVWKLDLTQLPPPVVVLLEQGIPQGQAMRDKLIQLATDIDAGKYATIDELKAALAELVPTPPPAPPAAETAPAGEVPAGVPDAPAPPADAPAPDNGGAAPAGVNP